MVFVLILYLAVSILAAMLRTPAYYNLSVDRASSSALMNSRALMEISSKRPSFASLGGHNSLPAPTANAPAASHSPTFVALTPPVGIIGILGNGALRAFIYDGPPNEPGKIFTTSEPSL